MKAKALAAKRDGQEVVCSLMLDEMSIRKHVEWDGKRYRGFADLGTGINDDDSVPEATDALVFMAVSVNSSWKVPCGYFLVAGLQLDKGMHYQIARSWCEGGFLHVRWVQRLTSPC